MLNIRLQENETPQIARDRLGDHAGTDSIVFSVGESKFIAPPEGPLQQLVEDLHTLEVKIFRLVGIPFEQDSRQGISADTARIKSMDLNRLLSHFADQTEALDYEIAALWAAGEYGAEAAIEKLDDDNLVIAHPTEFYTEQLAETVADATATIALGVGPTATALIKKRVVHVALRDISREQVGEIEQEIDERAPYDADEAELIADAAKRSGRPGNDPQGQVTGDPSGKGGDPNNGPDRGAGRSMDPRAGAARPAAAPSKAPDVKPGRKPTTIVGLRRQHKPLRG
jgi:hypothetical protein